MKEFISQFRRLVASSSKTTSSSTLEYPSLVNGLPVELHLQILSYLNHDDVIACLHTSHSLRCIWESPSIWPILADRWYPGLSTQLRLIIPVSQCGAAFRRFLTGNRRRSQGRFLSSLHHGMRLEDDEYFVAPLSRALPVAQGGVHEYAAVPDLRLLAPPPPPASSSSSAASSISTTGEGAAAAAAGNDERGHQYTRTAHFVAYANGRIAWWPEAYSLPYFAIVDDLRTRRRRGYLFPGHGKERRGYMTCLSDTMLLMARGRTLHAWNFADPPRKGDGGGGAAAAAASETLRSVVMPQPIARTLCENGTVLIVSQGGEVWLWRPRFHDDDDKHHHHHHEEPPRKIDIAGAHCYVPGRVLSDRYDIRDIAYRACRVGLRIQQPPPPLPVAPSSINDADEDDDFEQTLAVTNNTITLDFILHPTRRDIFFLATLQDRKLTVYEFSTDGTLLHTFLPDFPSPSLQRRGEDGDDDDDGPDDATAAAHPAAAAAAPSSTPNHLLPPRWAAHRGGLRWEKTSAHGDFSLLPIWLGGQQTNAPFDATMDPAAPVICPRCRDAGFVAVCFNVYTKTFAYPCFETTTTTTTTHHNFWRSSSSSLKAFRLWNGRLTERLSASAAVGAGEEEWPLMVLRPCSRRQGVEEEDDDDEEEREIKEGEHGHIPLYTTTRIMRSRDDHPLVARRREISMQSHWRVWQTLPPGLQERLQRSVELALDPDQNFAEGRVQRQGSNPTPSLGVQSLWGDDDFLIYINNQVYTVWQFSG